MTITYDYNGRINIFLDDKEIAVLVSKPLYGKITLLNGDS